MHDFYSDQGALFVKLAYDQTLPDFVKEGAFDESYDVSGLPARSFADPNRRLFPCSTPADTYVSAAYYHAQKEASTAVEDNLRKFAKLHGIEAEVAVISEAAKRYRGGGEPAVTKTAGAQTPTAWTVESSLGTWRGEGFQSLAKAAAQFVGMYANFELAELQRIAGDFVKAAQGSDYPVATELLRLAGQTAPDGHLARRAVQARGLLLREGSERQKVAAASLEVDVENFTHEEAMKVAAWIERFDADRGLRFHYGRELTDPMRSAFGTGAADGSDKVAAADERTVRVGSHLVKVAEFDEAIGKAALGEEFTRERLLGLTEEENQVLAQYL